MPDTISTIAEERITPEDFGAGRYSIDDDAEVYIWSGEHEAYWREGRYGYTEDLSEAQRTSLAEAFGMTSDFGPEKQIEFLPVQAAQPDESRLPWHRRFATSTGQAI